MYTCNKCGLDFQPTSHQIKKRAHLCNSCRRTYEKEWRQRRKEEGRPVVTSKMTPEYHSRYGREWANRPGAHERQAERQRKRMESQIEQHRARARRLVRTAISNGSLIRQPCEICENPKTDAHHDDYEKPLEVRWLCRLHHRKHHLKA